MVFFYCGHLLPVYFFHFSSQRQDISIWYVTHPLFFYFDTWFIHYFIWLLVRPLFTFAHNLSSVLLGTFQVFYSAWHIVHHLFYLFVFYSLWHIVHPLFYSFSFLIRHLAHPLLPPLFFSRAGNFLPGALLRPQLYTIIGGERLKGKKVMAFFL